MSRIKASKAKEKRDAVCKGKYGNETGKIRKGSPSQRACESKRMLETAGETSIPSTSTVNAILHRKSLITKEASKATTPYKRFEKSLPQYDVAMRF